MIFVSHNGDVSHQRYILNPV